MSATGQQLRDEGIQLALTYEPEAWKENYLKLAEEWFALLPRGESFLAERLNNWVFTRIGAPHHPNVWGGVSRPVINKWLEDSRITPNGFRQATNPGKRAHIYREYRKI